MDQKARQLADIVREKKTTADTAAVALRTAEDQLTQYQKTCPHNFTVTYDPIYHKAYTIPGDPPGTMGVDWRGPTHVPAETEDRWKRECPKCGLVEYTQRTRTEEKKTPEW